MQKSIENEIIKEDTPKKGVTMKDMCEVISKHWKENRCCSIDKMNDWTPEQIFNYSSSGDLSRIFEWYEDARFELKMIKCDECDSHDIVGAIKNYKTGQSIYLCKEHADQRIAKRRAIAAAKLESANK